MFSSEEKFELGWAVHYIDVEQNCYRIGDNIVLMFNSHQPEVIRGLTEHIWIDHQ